MKKGIKHLFIDELCDILSCEEQIVRALPKLVRAAESEELKKAFSHHLKETRMQVARIKKIFTLLKVKKKAKACKAIKGLIHECSDVLIKFKKKSPLRDASLIAKAQRIEHYEISAYGTLRTFAKEIGLDTASSLLQETLDEEANADKKLGRIAEGGLIRSGINHQANVDYINAKPKKPVKAVKKTTKRRKKTKVIRAKHRFTTSHYTPRAIAAKPRSIRR